MNRLTTNAILAITILCTSGGHWTVLQSTAWIGMIFSYSLEEKSIASGLEATFSGERPCGLCHLVEEGKRTEKQSPAAVSSLKKIEGTLARSIALPARQPDARIAYERIHDTPPPDACLDTPAPVPIPGTV